MRDIDERAVGLRLGFPECCVEAFVNQPLDEPAGAARGAVYGIRRDGTLYYYVPCEDCMTARPQGYVGPDDYVLGAMLQGAIASMDPSTMTPEGPNTGLLRHLARASDIEVRSA